MAKGPSDLARRQDAFLFDERPMELEGFRLKARSVDVIGRPTLAQFAAALDFALGCGDGSPYWIGALWNYGEGRADWREKIEQSIRSQSAYTHKSLINLGYIVRNTSAKARELAPSVGHVSEVAALEPEEQVEWMERSAAEGLTVRELRMEIKTARRRKVIDGQAVLEGLYRVAICDPPWDYGDRPPSGSGASQHYQAMSIDQLCKMPIAAHLAPDAVMFMWVTAPFLLQNPGPREVLEAWGLTPKTGMVWYKRRHNFGHYVSVRHEHVIIATRGSCTPDRPTPMVDSVFTSAQERFEHSEKPEELRQMVERMYNGPYLEIFARRPAAGWATFGNDERLAKQA